VPLGLSGLSSILGASLTKYRPLFFGLTIILLGLSHYLVSKNPNPGKASKVILWVSTILAFGILAYTTVQNYL